MRKPLMTKLEREYIALLRLYRHKYHVPVNDLVNTAVEEYLAKLYNISKENVSYRGCCLDAEPFMPPY